MLGDITAADEIYIVTGRTDMRKSIDGLCLFDRDKRSKEQAVFFALNEWIGRAIYC